MSETNRSSNLTRREFVSTATAATAAAALPGGAVLAQTPAKYRRLNISEPGFPVRVLDSYKKAIRAMLALPPTDPRNWYRNALVHTMDCPHGNWWFLVWHRGYIGWFEQICRELSGDPDFTLPYWDWTKEPRVPAAMFDDVLTPVNAAYIPAFNDFKTAFSAPLDGIWNGLSTDQFNTLLARGLRFPADLWWDIENYPMFFDTTNARGLTPQQPGFDTDTQKAVSLPTVLNALAPRDFLTFGSAKTLSHGSITGFGVLEQQPHNRVHNCVGGFYMNPRRTGFMQDNLSPVDPLFFLHHANIDRLWDVWTRKQQAYKYPILPAGDDLVTWSKEKFLFFTDSKGAPVTKTVAGDYAAIGDFNYDYQPGSGEEVVPKVAVAALQAARPVQSFSVQMTNSSIGASKPAAGSVRLSDQLLAGSGAAAPALFAKVTIATLPLAHEHDFTVQIGNSANPAENETLTISMFGRHAMLAPVTFTVPLSAAVGKLRSNKLLAANAPLNIRVVPQKAAMAPMAMRGQESGGGAEVLSIVVEAH
ncbi:MAG: tyrosinase family protein [Rhizobiales bacterium]|nr:tyrosinase family protein [Hyphomicrobiales bacterium]